MSDSHARLLAHIFTHLAGPEERLPTAWIAGQMANLDRVDGDIDTLMVRIAHTRTWTYITHRGDWVEGATAWQERARGIEDRLSDALHDRITQRFVDRRSAFLVRRLASDDELIASVSAAGEVRVEGAYVGRLDGLRFVPDAIDGIEMRMLTAAANRVLRSEVAARAQLLAADSDAAFAIDAAGVLRWRGGPVGRLVAGERMLTPRAEPLAGDFVEGEAREKIRQRLSAFVRAEIERRLAPLFAASALPLGGVGRGLAFQLADALGALPAREVASQITALAPADRAALSRHGVRFGIETVYVEPLLRPEALRFRALLWAVRHGCAVPTLPPARRLAKAIDVDPAFAAVLLRSARFLRRRPARPASRSGRAGCDRGATPRPPWCVHGRRATRIDCRRRAGRAAHTAHDARLSRGDRRRRRDLCRTPAPPPRSDRSQPSAPGEGGPSIRQIAGAQARLIAGDRPTETSSRRLDQWLWFARLVKSRSLAGRLCAAGGGLSQSGHRPQA